MKYRYHWCFKLLALVLAFVSGAVLMLGCAGLVLDDLGWYEDIRQDQVHREIYDFTQNAAEAVFDNFAWKDTGIEPKLFERFFRWGADVDAVDSLEHEFHYTIRREHGGEILAGSYAGGRDWAWSNSYHYDVRRGYVTEMPKADHYPDYEEFQSPGMGMLYVAQDGQPLPALNPGVSDYEYYVVSEESSVNWQNVSMDSYDHADARGLDYTIYRLEYTGYESYWVEIHLSEEQKAAIVDIDLEAEFIPQFLETHHDLLRPMVIWGGVCLLMAVLLLALLAGGSPHREGIRPGGLNLIPLDLYLAGAGCAALLAVFLTAQILEGISYNSNWGNYEGMDGMEYLGLDMALLSLMGGGCGLVCAMFFMACAAQMKMGNGYWLKHTAVGICWRYGWKFGKEAVLWCWKVLKKIVRGVMDFFAGIGRACGRFWNLLPLMWQWLIVSGGVWFVMLLCLIMAYESWSILPVFLGFLLTIPLVLYGAYGFGILRDGAKKMSGGNLGEKIENRYLLGCFREFAGHLNTLGDVCIEAANRQMKSERMKSELITNVSHDIKTPLTSIINYVDLLQKTEDEQERKAYLEVLDRQSQQLKKLIEDLMDMSKASSGNMSVEITPTDVCEAVNQALGEFIDKLDERGLKVMLKAPAEPLMALCDGRHLWRVLSNVLGNVVKYAMPGTRVYVDVLARGNKAEISVKNISAEMLGVSAEELMERFVRGDSSRNTEGNGLGLNIARSLMELQGGKLDLVVDGDLFKVVLTLTLAGEA